MILFKRLRRLEAEIKRLNNVNDTRDFNELFDKATKLIGCDIETIIRDKYPSEWDHLIFPSNTFKLLNVRKKKSLVIELIVLHCDKPIALIYDTKLKNVTINEVVNIDVVKCSSAEKNEIKVTEKA